MVTRRSLVNVQVCVGVEDVHVVVQKIVLGEVRHFLSYETAGRVGAVEETGLPAKLDRLLLLRILGLAAESLPERVFLFSLSYFDDLTLSCR